MPGVSRRSRAPAANVMPATITKAKMISAMAASDLDPCQPPDDQEADDLEREPGADRHWSCRRGDQGVEIVRRQEVEDDREHQRAEAHEDGGLSLLLGEHTGVAQQLESLANDVGEAVEDLGQIAARAALDPHGVAEELHVLDRDTLMQARERLTRIDTQTNFLGHVTELVP